MIENSWKYFLGSLSSTQSGTLIESMTGSSFTPVSDSNEIKWFDWLSLIILIYTAFSTAPNTPIVMTSTIDLLTFSKGYTSVTGTQYFFFSMIFLIRKKNQFYICS